MSEQQNNPTFKASELEPGVATRIKLVSSKEIASGTSSYGEWRIWKVEVTNQKVFDKGSKSPRPALYTGEAIMFPSDKLHEKFMNITGGNKENTEVDLTMNAKKGKVGFYTEYDVVVVNGGNVSPSSVSYSENTLVVDFTELVKENMITETKELFFEVGKDEPYNCSPEELEKLWQFYKEQK